MKISRDQLQAYFVEPLPSLPELVQTFTFHSFEIDGVEGDVMDVKVLPNRAADCSTASGIALELAALLDHPLKDEIPPTYSAEPVTISLVRLNGILGSDFSSTEVVEVFRRLRFMYEQSGDVFMLRAPEPRTDIIVAEDVAEEVGRVLGYERVLPVELPPTTLPVDQNRFNGAERMKDQLVEEGYSEVSTQSFAKKGDVYLANPMNKQQPALRTSLEANVADALARATLIGPLVLPPGEKPKLFEVGTVFPKDDEHVELRMSETVKAWSDNFPTVDNLSVAKLDDYGKDYTPKRSTLGHYHAPSVFPFIIRDIAAWAPTASSAPDAERLILESAGSLLVRLDHSDTYEKDGRTSFAFRLIFQAKDRTLTDEEVNTNLEQIASTLVLTGYEVR